MEDEEQRAVEVLEGKLSGLNLKEETKKDEDNKLDELKARFNLLVQKGKEKSKDGDYEAALQIYRKAYKIHSSGKLDKRIKRLEEILENSDSDSNSEQEGYTDCGDGFLLSDRIYNKLYPYQKEGVRWFWKLYRERKGGILGDDMGLGKTVQVISFLAGMFEQEHIKTAIIVMPVSLLANWQREFQNWAPEIRVRDFHGTSQKQRSENLARIQSRNGVCLTTYGLVSTCHSKFSQDKYGREFIWDYIILDEGHKIKNTATKTTKAMRYIPARNHFILTGTPIQNNLREMWALFDFVCEGNLLGTSRSFKQEYENPIVRARERDATAYEKRIGQEMSTHLRELIAPHFLRRTKALLENKSENSNDKVDGEILSEVPVKPDEVPQEAKSVKQAKLTRKNDLIIWVYLSETQLQIYKDFIELDRVKEILMTTRSPLAELNVLKKMCDHPRLLSTMACSQLGLNEDQDDDCDENYQWCAPPVEQLIEESGKMVFLVQLLQQLKKDGHRTLVFSQSRKMLDIIQKVLKDKCIKMIRIDGTITKVADRESRIQTFQNDSSISVFLLTTQVGGVGLTLTAADRVVIFDPSWNPATDAQAVDRAYRIGQKNTVVVYRLITCGSLEEKIYRKQVFKQAITKQTTGSSNNPMRYFTRHDLRDLFVLDDPKSSKTQQQLHAMHSANRVSDEKLDEHLTFLQSTDIFGISDHDLLFTKEAVSTQEELNAAAEMGDAIQAKVRRAADIMRAESSQAVRTNPPSTPSVPKKKTSQTKIHDHIEIFKPSLQDSKRFMPKYIQPSRDADVIDITVLDNGVDEKQLDEQFSAFNINDDKPPKSDSPKIQQIILDESDQNIDEESVTHSSDDIPRNHNTDDSPSRNFQEAKLESSRNPTPEGISGNGVSDDVGSPLDDSRDLDISEKSRTSEESDVTRSKEIPGNMEDSSGVSSSPEDEEDDYGVIRTKKVGKTKNAIISDESDEEDEERDEQGEKGNEKDSGIVKEHENRNSSISDEDIFRKELDAEGKASVSPDEERSNVSKNDDLAICNMESDDKERPRVSQAVDLDYGLGDDDNVSGSEDGPSENIEEHRDSRGTNEYNGDEDEVSGNSRDEVSEDSVDERDKDGVIEDSEEDIGDNEDHDRGSKDQEAVAVEDVGDNDDIGNSKDERDKDGEYGEVEDSEEDIGNNKDHVSGRKDQEAVAAEDIGDSDDLGNSEDERDKDGEYGEIEDSEEDIGDNEDHDSGSKGQGVVAVEDVGGSDGFGDSKDERDKEGDYGKIEDSEKDIEGNADHSRQKDRDVEDTGDSEDFGDSGDERDSEDERHVYGEMEDSEDEIGDNEDHDSANKDQEVNIAYNIGKNVNGVDMSGHGETEEIRDTDDDMDNEDEEAELGTQRKRSAVIIGDSDQDGGNEGEEVELGTQRKRSAVIIGDSDEDGGNEGEEVELGTQGDEGGNSVDIEDSDEDSEEASEYESCDQGEGDSSSNEVDQSSTDATSSPEQETPASKKTSSRKPITSESEEDEDKENIARNDSNQHQQTTKSGNVLSPKKKSSNRTTCCPRGKHVSDMINIRRCPCIMTSEEQEAYKMHVNSARSCEKSKQMRNALNHFVKALKLCDSDERLHYRIKKLYDTMQATQE